MDLLLYGKRKGLHRDYRHYRKFQEDTYDIFSNSLSLLAS